MTMTEDGIEKAATIDSEEEDDDYVPGADPDAPSDDDENDAGAGPDDDGSRSAPLLSITKRKAVDDAFFDLFGYRFASPDDDDDDDDDGKTSHDENLPAATGGNERLRAAFSSKRKRRSSNILSSIFGRRATLKLMRHAASNAALARPKRGGGLIRLERRTIVEVRRFAGQEIRVERIVTVPIMAGDDDEAVVGGEEGGATTTTTSKDAGDANPAAQRRGEARGVDSLLTELSRPERMSTVAKTSADWDLFKTKNADATFKEQLEERAAGNEAYLVKRDFLDRVDGRRFELERMQRDRERAKRGK